MRRGGRALSGTMRTLVVSVLAFGALLSEALRFPENAAAGSHQQHSEFRSGLPSQTQSFLQRAETSQNGAGAEAVDGGEKEKERAGWMASFLGTKETSLPEDAKIIEECEKEKWCNPDNAPAGDGDKSNSCTMDNKLDGTINGCSCKAPPVGGEGFVAKKATGKKQVTMQDGNKADKDVTTCAKTPICTEEQQKKCGQGTCEPGTGSAYTCACTADEHTEKDNKGCFPKECTPEQKAHCGSEGDCERSSKHPDGFKCGCPNYVLFKAADDVDGQKINGMKCLDNELCQQSDNIYPVEEDPCKAKVGDKLPPDPEAVVDLQKTNLCYQDKGSNTFRCECNDPGMIEFLSGKHKSSCRKKECEDNADKKRCGVKDASPNKCLVTSTAVKCECKGDTKSIKKIDIGRPWKDEDPDECVTELVEGTSGTSEDKKKALVGECKPDPEKHAEMTDDPCFLYTTEAKTAKDGTKTTEYKRTENKCWKNSDDTPKSRCECKMKGSKPIDGGLACSRPPPLFGCSQDKCRENGDTLAVCAHMSREKRKFITSPDDMEKHVQHACLCSALFKYDDAKDSCVLDETKVKTNEASCKKLDASLATFGDMKCNCPPHFRGGILAPMETAGQFEEMCWPDDECQTDGDCRKAGDVTAKCRAEEGGVVKDYLGKDLVRFDKKGTFKPRAKRICQCSESIQMHSPLVKDITVRKGGKLENQQVLIGYCKADKPCEDDESCKAQGDTAAFCSEVKTRPTRTKGDKRSNVVAEQNIWEFPSKRCQCSEGFGTYEGFTCYEQEGGVSSRSDASPTTGASEKLQEAETRVTELQQEIGGLTTKVTDAKTERDAAEKESFAAVAKSASMKEAAADLMAEIADRRKQTAALLSEMKKPEKHISNEQLDEFERMAEATNRQLENDLQQKEAEVREAEARSIKSTMVASRKAKELMAAEGSLTAGQTQLQEAQREKAIAGDLLEMANQEQAEERAVQQISRLQSELAKAKANAQVEKQLQKKKEALSASAAPSTTAEKTNFLQGDGTQVLTEKAQTRATQSKGTKTEAPTKSLTQPPSLLENAKEIPTKQMATPPADPEFNAAASRAFQEQLRSADSSLASQALMQARVQAADADLDAESPNLKETADPRKTLLEEEWAPYVPNTPPPVPTAMAEENDATGTEMPPTAGGGEDFDEFSSAFLEMRQTQRSVPRTPDQIQAAIEQQRQVIAQARQAEQEAAARMMQESAQIDSTIEASLTARETEAKKKVYRDSPDAPDGLHTAKVVMRQISLGDKFKLEPKYEKVIHYNEESNPFFAERNRELDGPTKTLVQHNIRVADARARKFKANAAARGTLGVSPMLRSRIKITPGPSGDTQVINTDTMASYYGGPRPKERPMTGPRYQENKFKELDPGPTPVPAPYGQEQ